MEELGIGRPSTYASTITTIQQREYVQKGDKPGEEFNSEIFTLKNGEIKHTTHTVTVGAERGKLLPTDTGTVVNDFLLEYFPEIMDYNFTADVEKNFDEIAEGKQVWENVIRDFYKRFNPLVEKTNSIKSEHRVGERVLGTDPGSGKPVSVKIGRFGPVAQIGSADDKEKPRFAQLKKGQSLETITLQEALELFRLPRELGEYEGSTIIIGAGKYGPYVLHEGKYVSLPKNVNPLHITQYEAIELINLKRKEDAEKHLKTFEEESDMEIMKGRFGAYLYYKGKNYHLNKAQQAEIDTLTYEQCLAIVEAQDSKPSTRSRYTKK